MASEQTDHVIASRTDLESLREMVLDYKNKNRNLNDRLKAANARIDALERTTTALERERDILKVDLGMIKTGIQEP